MSESNVCTVAVAAVVICFMIGICFVYSVAKTQDIEMAKQGYCQVQKEASLDWLWQKCKQATKKGG